jgi:hypothetical protein
MTLQQISHIPELFVLLSVDAQHEALDLMPDETFSRQLTGFRKERTEHALTGRKARFGRIVFEYIVYFNDTESYRISV